MKRFIGFLKKEFLHIFRDVRTMMIIFVIPVAQVLIFGYAVKNEIRDVHVAVYDQSMDYMTKEIVQKIDAAPDFIVSKYITNEADIENVLKSGEVKEVIVFGNDFAKNINREGKVELQLLLDASDPNLANLVNSYSSVIIKTYLQEQNANAALATMAVEPRMWFNEELQSAYMFVPGTMALILMLITAMMTSITIVREKEMGTMETLLVSPLKPIQIILGKVTPYIILSLVNACTILLAGHFVFEVPILGSPLLLLFVSFIFIILSLCLGILISTVAKTQQVAMFVSVFALMLPTLLLSGFIFPIENMPIVLQWFSTIVPGKYYLSAIKDVMLKGLGFEYIWKEVLVMIGMILLFLILSIKKFKIRLM